jgi:hypothetical protein
MLEGDLATNLVAGVHGAAHAILPGLDIGGIEQEVGGGRGAEVEGEGSVGADCDTRGNGNAGVDVSSAGVEFLRESVCRSKWVMK